MRRNRIVGLLMFSLALSAFLMAPGQSSLGAAQCCQSCDAQEQACYNACTRDYPEEAQESCFAACNEGIQDTCWEHCYFCSPPPPSYCYDCYIYCSFPFEGCTYWWCTAC
jgi:hypothetical protein